MKKLIVPAIILIAVIAAFAVNETIFSKANVEPYPTFQVTVYQTGGSPTQPYAEVIVENSSGTPVKTGTTDGSGVVSWVWDQPYGNYTVKSWYPARPNDGQSGQTLVSYSGSSTYTSVTLGRNY